MCVRHYRIWATAGDGVISFQHGRSLKGLQWGRPLTKRQKEHQDQLFTIGPFSFFNGSGEPIEEPILCLSPVFQPDVSGF